MTTTPILQFGTSRFLLAHVDLFVSEALARGEAIGKITIVQTTDSPESARRVAALASGDSYPVRIRGLLDGSPVDEERQGRAVAGALFAGRDWAEVRKAAVAADIILSNTGERGFDLHADDDAELLHNYDRVPKSFPAKLLMLLHERWQARPDAPVSVYPCELLQRNGDKLKALIGEIAAGWGVEQGFLDYLDSNCRFANSLVDRIVSEAIQPVGAIAEPYALWAIEAQVGLVLPCIHPSVIVTDDLDRYEHLKLHILNLGHTYLAECWLSGDRDKDELVREIMADPAIREGLESVWRDEVLPVFVADGLAREAEAYIVEVRDRFLNPFLAHRLSDIAGNHQEKKRRRIQPMIDRAHELGLSLAQPRLVAAMGH
ncbi:mannitol dehydrogenase family protein [Rhizobium sp. KVB221]|uniref:Mannitol dehydrogenase family protein n=1 Tax=Rhizobium setariae TaxID=2801340 RepID=A0A936YUP1_9HYPH|nr:mannitol dehydrogenase family protein [Rhizobium setariae]MBL0375004.1 mannitol dehydrogenase family protein [Rhizobium setariae]